MMRILNLIQKKLVIAIPVAMIAGISYGSVTDVTYMKGLILPLTFLMVYPMMIGMNLKEVLSNGGKKANLLALIINFGIIPFVALGIGRLFFGAEDKIYLIVGLLLSALLPTSGMTISWTGFAKGNMNSAVKMTIIGLIAGAILTPIYVNFLVGASINMPFIDVLMQVLTIVFVPMMLGNITQRILLAKFGSEQFKKEIKPNIQSIASVGVLGIVFIAMATKAKVITGNPQEFLTYFIPILVLYMTNFAISTLVGKLFLGRDDAIALVYGTVMRNLSIALALAMTVFKDKGADAAIIISISYIIQVQSAAMYVKFTDKIFGKKEAVAFK